MRGIPWFSLMACILLHSCSVNPTRDAEEPWRFTSHFDDASLMRDLFPSDLSGWTNVQCIQPGGNQASEPSGLSVVSGTNSIRLDSVHAVSGTTALRFEAPPSGTSVSKASIAKEGVDFKPGDKVTARFKIFLADNGSAENLFLVDFESTELNGYPGRRLALSSSQELILESKNSGAPYGSGPHFKPSSTSKVAMPKGRWVAVEIELYLSRGQDGFAKIWQDGALMVDAKGQTFPIEPEISHFNWVEFGITANASGTKQELWMDDISLSRN